MTQDPPAEDRMPFVGFAVMFLLSPLLMALAIVALRYRHEIAESRLALPLVVGHLTAILAFVGIWAWRRAQQKP